MKYNESNISSDEKPDMACETIAPSTTQSMEQVHMSFNIPSTVDENSFRVLMMVYAQNIIKRESGKKKRCLSDEELEAVLASEPSFPTSVNKQLDTLTNEDYSRFMRKRKAMKGIEKWL